MRQITSIWLFLHYTSPKENAKSLDTSVEELRDLSELIFKRHGEKRAYTCTDLDHGAECETECRDEIASLLGGYSAVKDASTDNFDLLAHRDTANLVCTLLDKVIQSPGVEIIARVETGPRLNSMHKDLRMGNICCARVCHCEIVYKHVNRSLNRVELSIDLRANLTKRPLSFYCDQGLSECIEDCQKAAGVHLRSDMLQETSVVSPLDVDIFSKMVTARRACVLFNRPTVKLQGVNVFLKYSTRRDTEPSVNYPAKQELLLGNVCCEVYFGIPLFPFNRCQMWDHDDIIFDLED